MEDIIKSQLKDFQRATVDYVFGRFFESEAPASRFLVADEVGLGKTLIARGIIEKFYSHFKRSWEKNLKVIYICSNQSVASQNISRLNIEKVKEEDLRPINRINQIAIQKPHTGSASFLEIIALSPNTSFNVSSGGGISYERAIIYHILSSHPTFKFYRKKLSKLFQLDVGDTNWSYLVSENSREKVDLRPDIAAQFNLALDADKDLFERLSALCEVRYSSQDHYEHRRLMGCLRRLLAAVCVKYLKPDLMILDEFQRFKNVINQEEDSEVRMITESLFKDPEIKTLLLSATPYKMYTVQSEEDEGESHYEEFKFIIRFLLNNEQEYRKFLKAWDCYSQSLLHLKHGQWDFVKTQKQAVESYLRKYIARTERIAVSDDHNTLLRSSGANLLWVRPPDVKNFISADAIAAKLGEYYQNIHSPVEYCKSSPYPFSFMEGYQLQRIAQRAIKEKNGDFLKTLKANRVAFLPREEMNDFKELVLPSAKLKYLLDDSLYNGGADLLWIPPALPYYQFDGPFRDKETYSKTLVFSSWVMVPKMIAGLTSYECERLTIGHPEAKRIDEKTVREYFQTGKDRHPRSRLNFKIDGGTYSTLPQYALLYPCLALAGLWEPYSRLALTRTLQEEVQDLKYEIEHLVNELGAAAHVTERGKAADDRWALILMILLDKRHHGETIKDLAANRRNVNWDWFNSYKNDPADHEEQEASSAKKYYEKVFTDILFSQHSNKDYLAELGDLKLGPIPENVVEQLAYLALASPAIGAFRLLQAYADKDTSLSIPFFGAFRIADSYRKFFNTPENIAVVDKCTDVGSYWERVLQYLAWGNFQSLLDEYAAVIIDHHGLWDLGSEEQLNKLSFLLSENNGLRTVWVNGQTFESFTKAKVASSHLRCHFGVALNQSLANDKDVMRNDKVRDAFNSPFRPFILTTTSIGQEGLDFHLYCRKLLHWNLPANPVDFEQREGRINRFKNLAIRQNLAKKYRSLIDKTDAAKLWTDLFSCAAIMEKGKKSDLVPYWHLEPEHIFIERQVPTIPYSREVRKLKNLLKTISIYRVALGQPRQEELVNHIIKDFTEDEIRQLQADLLINLSPFSYKAEQSTVGELQSESLVIN